LKGMVICMNNLEYVLFLGFIGFLILLRRIIDNKVTKILPYIALALFSGFRYNVGIDYNNYNKIYNVILENNGFDIEYGYYLLTKAVIAIGGTQQLIFLIFASATSYFLYKFINEFSRDKDLSLFMYCGFGPYYLSSFNGMREALAVLIFAYSLKYIKDKQFGKFVAIMLLTSLIHQSAILMIPMYFILSTKLNIKALIITFIVYYLGIYKTGLIHQLLKVVGYNKYNYYQSLNMDNSYLIFLIIAVICYGIIMYIDKKEKIRSDIYIFINMSLLSFLIVIAAYASPGISNIAFTRMNSYFFVSYIVLVPYIVGKFKQRILIKSGVVSISVLYFLLVTASTTSLLPYMMSFKLFE